MHPNARQLLAAALALLTAATSWASDVRTSAQEGSAPKFVALDGKGKVGGLCVDILRAIERVEPDLRFIGDQQWHPLLRVEVGLGTGAIDAACGLIQTKERLAKHDFIPAPLFSVNYLLVARAGDNVQVADWQDVRNLGENGVVLTIHGYVGILAHMRGVGGLRIDSGGRDTRVNLEKLVAGRGRFFVHRSPGITGEIANSSLRDKVKILPTSMYTETFYMMVAKSMPPAVKDKIGKALLQLTASGELAKLSA